MADEEKARQPQDVAGISGDNADESPKPLATNPVLLVDDEGATRHFLNRYLQSIGVREVLEAANGQEALDIARQRLDLKLILLDLKMPVLDGIDALRQIRIINPRVPIAIVTAYPEYDGADKTLANGAFEFIQKPIDLEQLNKTIDIAQFLSPDS